MDDMHCACNQVELYEYKRHLVQAVRLMPVSVTMQTLPERRSLCMILKQQCIYKLRGIAVLFNIIKNTDTPKKKGSFDAATQSSPVAPAKTD